MHLFRSKKAIELVEAAITTPIVILLMLAVINLGMLVYGQQAVQAAARQGARMGSVAQECPACYAVSAAKSEINTPRLVQNSGVSVLASGGNPGSLLTIQVTGQIPNFMGEFVPGLPAVFNVSAQATFRQEGW